MKHKDVLMQVLHIFLCEVGCIGVMLLVYSLMEKMDKGVLLGALLGGLIAIGNFLFLSICVSRAADKAAKAQTKEAAAKATLSVQRNSLMRKFALIAIYILLLRSKCLAPLPLILPLVFVQASIYILEFFRKDGGKK